MPVKYKYPNEEEVIVSGDDFEVNFYRTNIGNYFQAVGSIYYSEISSRILFISPVIRTNQATIINEPDSQWLISSNANTNDSDNVWFALGVIESYEYYPQGKRSNPEPNAKDIQQALEIIPNADPSSNFTGLSQARRLGGNRYFTKVVNKARTIGGGFFRTHISQLSSDPQIHYYHPCQYTSNYTLLIYNGETLTFNRTEDIPPEYVEILEGKQCPNNTCPVRCGDNVCCYGSDGIATESFLFSESIYQ